LDVGCGSGLGARRRSERRIFPPGSKRCASNGGRTAYACGEKRGLGPTERKWVHGSTHTTLGSTEIRRASIDASQSCAYQDWWRRSAGSSNRTNFRPNQCGRDSSEARIDAESDKFESSPIECACKSSETSYSYATDCVATLDTARGPGDIGSATEFDIDDKSRRSAARGICSC
jgi:hypothetical protein